MGWDGALVPKGIMMTAYGKIDRACGSALGALTWWGVRSNPEPYTPRIHEDLVSLKRQDLSGFRVYVPEQTGNRGGFSH